MDTVSKDNPATDANMGSESHDFDLSNCTLEQFDSDILTGKNRKLRDEYLSLDDNDPVAIRINKMLDDRASGVKPESGNTDDSAQQDKEVPDKGGDNGGGTQSDTGTDDEGLVEIKSLKVRKDLFEKYLTGGRSVEEAAVAALEASGHGERMIRELKDRNDGLADKTLKLRDQLDASNKAKTEAERRLQELAQRPTEQSGNEVEEFDLDEDEIDLYDPDHQEKLLNAYKGIQKKLKEIESGKVQPQSKQEPVPPKEKETPSSNDDRLKDLRDIANNREFDEIAELQSHVPELHMDRPFQAVDADVYNFRMGVKNALGVENWSDAERVYYSETDQGKALRDTCRLRGIQPPAEFETWSKIIDIRSVRNKNIKDRAVIEGRNELEIKPLPNNSYYDIYRLKNPVNLNAMREHARIDSIKNAAKNQRPDVVPEPHGGDISHNNAANPTEAAEQLALIQRYERNPESISQDEAKLLLSWLPVVSPDLAEDPPVILLKKAKG